MLMIQGEQQQLRMRAAAAGLAAGGTKKRQMVRVEIRGSVPVIGSMEDQMI